MFLTCHRLKPKKLQCVDRKKKIGNVHVVVSVLSAAVSKVKND